MYKPLITILVASYNAESYIEETLNSCINQEYQNIEIIIADDCSTDLTVNKIHCWLTSTKNSYPNVICKLVPSSKNNGITRNFNNGLQYAKGEWIKCLGSDDILCQDALSKFVMQLNCLSDINNVGAIFTNFETFGTNVTSPIVYPLAWTRSVVSLKPSFVKRNLAMLHFNNVAPGAFINKKFIKNFDENYKMLEDLPLWLKLINNNVKTHFFNYTTVKYRIHGEQITSSSNKKVNNLLIQDLKMVNKYRRINKYYISFMHHKFNIYCSSKRTFFYTLIKVMDPFNILIKIYERVNK